ncbi:MAG: hypothetical protein LBD03_07715, partial [Methanobrevibacter sp.]|nr:hypothetical protein [Candidatus Methanovirga procula]
MVTYCVLPFTAVHIRFIIRGSQDEYIRRYSCKSCGKNFNDFTKTLFANSKIPFRKLLYILVNMKFKSVYNFLKNL